MLKNIWFFLVHEQLSFVIQTATVLDKNLVCEYFASINFNPFMFILVQRLTASSKHNLTISAAKFHSS